MDLLCNAYSTASDDDDEPQHLAPSKRHRPEPPRSHTKPLSVTEPPIPGRYISKREQAALASASASVSRASDPSPPSSVAAMPVVGSILDSDLSHDILSSLRHQTKGRAGVGKLSESLSVALNGHSKAVNVVQWSTSHVSLQPIFLHLLGWIIPSAFGMCGAEIKRKHVY